jgi:hypothetical protein
MDAEQIQPIRSASSKIRSNRRINFQPKTSMNPREMMRFSIVGGKESEGLINNDEEPFIDGLIRIVEG